jgi:hypothetical protein
MVCAPLLAAVAALVSCGSATGTAGTAGTAAATPDAGSCAFVGPLSDATGVGPRVVFVTRGAGAQRACDAELADPRNASRHFAPAYVPTGAPVCTYFDSHDAPPEGGRSYELFGDGASTLCEAITPRPSGG